MLGGFSSLIGKYVVYRGDRTGTVLATQLTEVTIQQTVPATDQIETATQTIEPARIDREVTTPTGPKNVWLLLTDGNVLHFLRFAIETDNQAAIEDIKRYLVTVIDFERFCNSDHWTELSAGCSQQLGRIAFDIRQTGARRPLN
ncbi:hypothetical protein M3Y95_00772800 [Aphelenchoides besseyi]|nr:hypothetical protein M3Y95_00772800 [Aphelenchoides besseyi]